MLLKTLSAVVPTLGLCLFYIVCSSGLIAYNKYLMHPNVFPFSIVLVTMHMSSCFILSLTLFMLRPSLFPSLQEDRERLKTKMTNGFKVLLPLCAFFAGTLVLSNQAYLYCSIAFLQMMKDGNLILVYLLSLAVGLEVFNSSIAKVVFFVFCATIIAVVGEIRFVWIGFFIQVGSQLCETCKIVLQNAFLTVEGLKFDPLSFVLLMSPFCFIILAVKMVAFQFHHEVWLAILEHWPLLLGNVLNAFVLNIAIAILIKHAGALAFLMAGLVKDICIVSFSAIIFHDPISGMQMSGFALQLCGIFVYSIMRTFPEEFQHGVVTGFHNLLRAPERWEYKKEEDTKTGSSTDPSISELSDEEAPLKRHHSKEPTRNERQPLTDSTIASHSVSDYGAYHSSHATTSGSDNSETKYPE